MLLIQVQGLAFGDSDLDATFFNVPNCPNLTGDVLDPADLKRVQEELTMIQKQLIADKIHPKGSETTPVGNRVPVLTQTMTFGNPGAAPCVSIDMDMCVGNGKSVNTATWLRQLVRHKWKGFTNLHSHAADPLIQPACISISGSASCSWH